MGSFFFGECVLIVISCNNKYVKDCVYIGIGCRIGYALKNYHIDEKEYVVNPAFSFLFKCYIEKQFDNIIVLEENSFLYFFTKESKDDFNIKLEKFLSKIFSLNVSEKVFENVKEIAKESFRNKYKNAECRAVYKSYEILEVSKRFSLAEYINSFDSITYNEFLDAYDNLVTIANSVLVINGKLQEIESINHDVINCFKKSVYSDLRISYNKVDNYLLRDASVLALEGEKVDVDILSFRFDYNTQMIDRLAYLCIEMWKAKCVRLDIHLDECDCGIILLQKQIESSRELFREIVTEEEFIFSKNILTRRIGQIQENEPYEYMRLILWLRMLGLRMDDVADIITDMDYESYVDISKRVKPIVQEAQIVMR